MVVVYDSMTGNARRFALKVLNGLPHTLLDLRKDSIEEIEDFVLITHTFGKGEVPETTRNFLAKHGRKLRAVCSSGSIHWGEHFGRAGDIISSEYSVPLVIKFNKSGTNADIETARRWLICNG
jgi:protein involved in ribonucleotide reduction